MKFRKKPIVVDAYQLTEEKEINTREGTLKGYPGDWIITGIQGEIYPCGKDIFEATYEPIDVRSRPAPAPIEHSPCMDCPREVDHIPCPSPGNCDQEKCPICSLHCSTPEQAATKAREEVLDKFAKEIQDRYTRYIDPTSGDIPKIGVDELAEIIYILRQQEAHRP